MSSKSRKHSSPPARSSKSTGHGSGPDAEAGAPVSGEVEHAEPTHKDFLDAEELLNTPQGRNPLVYAGLILMLVFLMLVFLLPPSMFNGQTSTNEVMMKWTHPTRGEIQVRQSEFLGKANEFSRLMSFFNQRSTDQAELAHFMILDELALENGITFSDEELKAELSSYARALGGTAPLEARLRRFPGGFVGFQETLRAFQRVNRYQSLLGKLQSIPDPAQIEESWNQQFLEYSFEYVFAGASDFVDEARAESPDDGVLQAWLDERPEFERNALMEPERLDAEVIGFVLNEANLATAGDELLAAYPNAEDWDEEVQADTYYKRYSFTRFRRPTDPDNSEPLSPDQLTFAYEEVRDTAAREARLFDAMGSFRADLQERLEAGEAIDLSVEAAALGMDRLADGVARSIDEWSEVEGLGGRFTGSQMYGLGDSGSITGSPAVTEDGLILVRLVERMPSQMPAFEEIREQVFEDWIESRSVELSEESLKELREELIPTPDIAETDEGTISEEESSELVTSELLAAAATARGLELRTRDWLQRSAKQKDDPNWEDPGHTFLRTRADLYQLEQGALSEPLANLEKSGAYLVRLVGEREVPIEQMTPSQYESLLNQASMLQSIQLAGGAITIDDLREKFGLWLLSEQPDPEDEADEGNAS